MVSLVKVTTIKNQLLDQPITYITEEGETVTFEKLDSREKSGHPREVVTRELKSKELKKIEKK
jgi:hypothetical protein